MFERRFAAWPQREKLLALPEVIVDFEQKISPCIFVHIGLSPGSGWSAQNWKLSIFGTFVSIKNSVITQFGFELIDSQPQVVKDF
jgi:hypothetical protein